MFQSLRRHFLTILKTSAIFTLALTFFVFFENCSCQKPGEEEEEIISDTGETPEPDENNGPPPPPKDPAVITLTSPTNIPVLVNVGDGFIPFLPSVEMNIERADFEESKINDPSKPCDNSFTITIKDDADGDVPLSSAAAVSCAYVETNSVTLTITPPVVDTNAYSISNGQVLNIALEVTANDNFTTSPSDVVGAGSVESLVRSIGTWNGDMTPTAASYQGHVHLFGYKVLTIDPTKPNSLKESDHAYARGAWSALSVGVQKNSFKSIYHLFEPSSSSSTSTGYLTYIAINLNDPNNLVWSPYALGGTLGHNNNGAYVNHNAIYFTKSPQYVDMVNFHGGYNHRFSTSAEQSPYNPTVRITPTRSIYNLFPNNYDNRDAGHIILQITNDAHLRVARHSTPYFQQLNQPYYTDPVAFNDLSSTVSGHTPTANNFVMGNKVLRTIDGNHYVYILGDTAPIVAETTLTGATITGISLSEIDNPMGSSFQLNNPTVVYDDTNDYLIVLISPRWGMNMIFIGKFDDGSDTTPTWSRYF